MRAGKRRWLGLVVWLVLAACAGHALPAAQRPTATALPFPDAPVLASKALGVLIVGFDPGIDHARAEAVLDAAVALQADWVRIGFIWALGNPEPDVYAFEEFDWLLHAVVSRGLKPLPVVMFVPAWASARPEAEDFYAFPPAETRVAATGNGYDALEAFARTIAARYQAEVAFWEFWNEPDMKASLHDANGNGSSADEYARMLAAFARGVRAGNPQAKVVLGGLAQGTSPADCEQDYLRKILADPAYPALASFDVLNFHTNFLSPADALARIAANRALLDRFGGAQVPLWITETSYTSEPRYQSLADYRGGEFGQARYVHDILAAQLASEAEVIFWALLTDPDPQQAAAPYAHAGLYTRDLQPKPAALAFREAAQAVRAARGGTRP